MTPSSSIKEAILGGIASVYDPAPAPQQNNGGAPMAKASGTDSDLLFNQNQKLRNMMQPKVPEGDQGNRCTIIKRAPERSGPDLTSQIETYQMRINALGEKISNLYASVNNDEDAIRRNPVLQGEIRGLNNQIHVLTLKRDKAINQYQYQKQQQ